MWQTRYSILVIFMMCIPFSLFGQGMFLSRGETAWYGAAGFFLNTETPGFALKGGYCYKGIADAELQWQKGKKGTPYSNLFIPRLSYYFVKEEDTPTAPTVGASLQYTQYTVTERTIVVVPINFPTVSYTRTEFSKNETYKYIILTGSIHRSLGTWRQYLVRPFAECGFGMSSKGWKFLWKIGTSLTKQTQQRSLFVLMPYLQREPNTTTIGITAGFNIQ